MADNYALDTDEEQNTIQAIVKHRGDSFDIGSTSLTKHPDIITILQNPTQLAGILDINEEQANNIRALIVGGGAGLSSKYLSKTFGSAVAGAFGGLVAGLLAEKIFKPRK